MQVGIINDHCCSCYKNPVSQASLGQRQPGVTKKETAQAHKVSTQTKPSTPNSRKRREPPPCEQPRRSKRAGRR